MVKSESTYKVGSICLFALWCQDSSLWKVAIKYLSTTQCIQAVVHKGHSVVSRDHSLHCASPAEVDADCTVEAS